MNHGLKLHPDGTLEITMPKGKKVGRVLVCESGTQNGSLYYPESDVPDINVGDMISRQMAIEALERNEEYNADIPNRADGVRDAIITISSLPSAEPKIKCVAKVTLSQEQIQDAVDKAVEKMKAELEPCDFCKHKDDCGYMLAYCPAERRTDE